MAQTNLTISGGIERTQAGNVDVWAGNGGVAWASLAAAKAGIPAAIRPGKIIYVLISGTIRTYWWPNPSAIADGDLVPYTGSAVAPAIISKTVLAAIDLRDAGELDANSFYLINNAVENTAQILITPSSTSSFYDAGIVMATGQTGTYSLDDDTFTASGGGLTYPINATGAINETATTLASAATVNIGAAAANSILITGTTNISAFDTIQAGTVRSLVFTGMGLTLVHSSNLQLPNDANLPVVENQVVEFTSLGGGAWKCTGIQFNYIPQNIASRQDVVLSSWPSDLGYPSTSALVAYSGTSITKADLITLRDAAGMATNQRFIITDATLPALMVMAIGASTLATTAISYFDSGSASFGTYDLDTDTFTSVYPGNPYLTLDRTAWDALVAANGLVAGWRYRVQSAYTFDVYGAKDIVVTADSVNTIEATTQVIFGDFYVPYTTDSAFNQGFFLYAYPAMALTGTQALAYISGYNWKFNNGLSMFLTDGSLFFEAQIQGSDSNAIIFDNVKALDISTWAAGVYGTFDPNTDTFTPYANSWAPAFTFDGTVVTSIGSVIAGKYSRNGNTLSYSIQIKGVDMDFTAGATGTITIADSEFPFTPTGGHVVTGVLSDPLLIGIQADDAATSLIISLYDPTVSLTGLANISITGQCLL